jgi:chromosome segregation ATPase
MSEFESRITDAINRLQIQLELERLRIKIQLTLTKVKKFIEQADLLIGDIEETESNEDSLILWSRLEQLNRRIARAGRRIQANKKRIEEIEARITALVLADVINPQD